MVNDFGSGHSSLSWAAIARPVQPQPNKMLTIKPTIHRVLDLFMILVPPCNFHLTFQIRSPCELIGGLQQACRKVEGRTLIHNPRDFRGLRSHTMCVIWITMWL